MGIRRPAFLWVPNIIKLSISHILVSILNNSMNIYYVYYIDEGRPRSIVNYIVLLTDRSDLNLFRSILTFYHSFSAIF